MESIDVSIIVPVYNSEKYIEQCIQKLIDQRNDNFSIEIVLVNDASTDKSSMLCSRFANKFDNIKLINKKKNEGVSRARNDGVKAATGKYICFCDSDDYYLPGALYKLYKYFESYSNVDIVISGTYTEDKDVYNKAVFKDSKTSKLYTDEDINIMKRWVIERNSSVFPELYYTDTKKKIAPLRMGFVTGKLIKKEIAQKTKFVENIGYMEDGIYIYDLFNFIKKVLVVEDVTYFHRNNSESITRKKYDSKAIQNAVNLASWLNSQIGIYDDRFDTSMKLKKFFCLKDAIYRGILANKSSTVIAKKCNINKLINSDIFKDILEVDESTLKLGRKDKLLMLFLKKKLYTLLIITYKINNYLKE